MSTYQHLRSVFHELDLLDDGFTDGQVSHVGLRRIILEIPEVEQEIGTPLARALLIRSEQNLLGLLSFEEFLIMAYELEQYSSGRYPKYQAKRAPRSLIHRLAVAVCVPIPERDSRLAMLERKSCYPPPCLLFILSLVQISVFIWYVIQQTNRRRTISANGPLDVHSDLIFNPDKREEIWRYLSYMLSHSGYFHFILNTAVQTTLGMIMEMVHRWWRILIIYFCAIFAGSLLTSIMDPNAYLVNHSSGVQALIMANLSNVLFNLEHFEMAYLRVIALLSLSLVDTGVAVYYRVIQDFGLKISFVSQLAGISTGFLLGIVMLCNNRTKPWQKYVWWISLMVQLAFFLIAIVWNAFLIALYV